MDDDEVQIVDKNVEYYIPLTNVLNTKPWYDNECPSAGPIADASTSIEKFYMAPIANDVDAAANREEPDPDPAGTGHEPRQPKVRRESKNDPKWRGLAHGEGWRLRFAMHDEVFQGNPSIRL